VDERAAWEVTAGLDERDAGKRFVPSQPRGDPLIRPGDLRKVRLADEDRGIAQTAARLDLDAEHVGVARGDRRHRAELPDASSRVVIDISDGIPEQVPQGGAQQLRQTTTLTAG
jgi:hypothetical protein